ncbi:hypothetical protein A946_00560 [Methylacidiphilum kamchatkense Kam1]|uniref:Knr4/Smi1-like domain-containing protein n=1 Tax=Methylacidiphilum kamchatkense Kam1 TaxID=1202785 RepID=A0ABR4ZYY9_9BACT|nr:hypothetical protein A946_00560 [Methylacidiphilum kamchatkense Kam1]
METLRSYEAEEPYIVFNPPASPQAIEEADKISQKEFGVAIPEVYKDLLAYANGFSFGLGYFYPVIDSQSSLPWLREEDPKESNFFYFVTRNQYVRTHYKGLYDHKLLLGESLSLARRYLYDSSSGLYYTVYNKGGLCNFINPTKDRESYEDLYSLIKAEVEFIFYNLKHAQKSLDPKLIACLHAHRKSRYALEGCFLPPASPSAIEKADRNFYGEFGVSIPQFYKDFLAYSNGFWSKLIILASIPDETSPIEWLRTEKDESFNKVTPFYFISSLNRYIREKAKRELAGRLKDEVERKAIVRVDELIDVFFGICSRKCHIEYMYSDHRDQTFYGGSFFLCIEEGIKGCISRNDPIIRAHYFNDYPSLRSLLLTAMDPTKNILHVEKNKPEE